MRPPVFRQELTPVSFLERSGVVHADRIAVVDGAVRYTWREMQARSRRLASALRGAGVRKDDRIAFLAPNSEPLLLAHFGVPQAGGVLVTLNVRLAAAEIGAIVAHAGATMVFVAPELEPLLEKVPASVRRTDTRGGFEEFLATGSDGEIESWLESEDDAISINYTSGTTGLPKGVVTHHRGAYLNALAVAIEHGLTAQSRFLWTLPMFHCNGWTYPWALAAVGARSVCIPRVEPSAIWRLLEPVRTTVASSRDVRVEAGPAPGATPSPDGDAVDDVITHFCAVPTVLIALAGDPAAHRLARHVRAFTGGAPPSPTLVARMAELNIALEHTYGLTETYGPFAINVPPADAASWTASEQARYGARQGFPHVAAGEIRVVEAPSGQSSPDETLRDVPADGITMGEVVMRGNVLMSGYYQDAEATASAFAGGWFHSGDLAVRHPDGSIELRDRKKDIVISGGENIGSIEVEQALASHPAVLECAVIAVPDEQWGEVPKAFVTLRPGATASEPELIDHCRARIARFKAPRSIEFGPLPRTSTGKVQKYVLREREWSGRDKRIH